MKLARELRDMIYEQCVDTDRILYDNSNTRRGPPLVDQRLICIAFPQPGLLLVNKQIHSEYMPYVHKIFENATLIVDAAYPHGTILDREEGPPEFRMRFRFHQPRVQSILRNVTKYILDVTVVTPEINEQITMVRDSLSGALGPYVEEFEIRIRTTPVNAAWMIKYVHYSEDVLVDLCHTRLSGKMKKLAVSVTTERAPRKTFDWEETLVIRAGENGEEGEDVELMRKVSVWPGKDDFRNEIIEGEISGTPATWIVSLRSENDKVTETNSSQMELFPSVGDPPVLVAVLLQHHRKARPDLT